MVSGEIINKIESAGLITLDLQDFIIPGNRIGLDLASWLDGGLAGVGRAGAEAHPARPVVLVRLVEERVGGLVGGRQRVLRLR